jgi:hypothetical protein
LIKNSIRDLGFLASGHGIAPFFPLCPNHTRNSGQFPDLWQAIADALRRFTPQECANYLAAAGYDAT